jgi:hypothetical protein
MEPSDFPVPFPVPDELWQTCPPPFRDVPQPLYPYAYFHNPFCLFERVLRDPERWKKLEDEAAFWRDLLIGDFPEFAWFSPNLWDDGHYLYGTCIEPDERGPLVDQQARWLQSFFESLRFPGPKSRLPPRTLVVVTYDETDFDQDYDAQKSTYDGPNQIYTVLLGDMIKPERRLETSNHYSLLKTVEKNFGLGSLEKNDRDANWWQFLWGKEFAWRQSAKTPVVAEGAVAAAGLGSVLYVVYVAAANALKFRVFEGGRWSAEQPVGSASGSGVALAARESGLILVYRNGDDLAALDYSPGDGWSAAPTMIVAGPVGAFSVASLEFNRSTMLAYATPGGGIQSMLFTEGQWAPAVDVGHSTNGGLVLATLGPSLFLIHEAIASDAMQVVSYNTADFNVVTVPDESDGSASDTTRDMWSPSQFPVAYFWRGPAPSRPDEFEPLRLPYHAGPCLAAATLDGVIHLAHPRSNDHQVVTETFAQSGMMTPANPVSWITAARAALLSLRAGSPPRSRYSIWSRFLSSPELKAAGKDLGAAAEKKPTCNGFGTLAEAGWSLQEPIHDVQAEAEVKLAARVWLREQRKPVSEPRHGEYAHRRVCKVPVMEADTELGTNISGLARRHPPRPAGGF